MLDVDNIYFTHTDDTLSKQYSFWLHMLGNAVDNEMVQLANDNLNQIVAEMKKRYGGDFDK